MSKLKVFTSEEIYVQRNEMLHLLKAIIDTVDDHEWKRGVKIDTGNPIYIAILALISEAEGR